MDMQRLAYIDKIFANRPDHHKKFFRVFVRAIENRNLTDKLDFS